MTSTAPGSKPARATGATALVATLESLGVHAAYGLPGVHNLAAWAALASSPIRLVGVRHEQAAVYAADGHARTTGELGVALTTTGPGAANALGATGEAWASHSPVLVVATDIPASLRRDGVYRGVLHETRDQAAMFAPVVKRTLVAESAADVARLTVEAAAEALRAPCGPTYLQIPTDVLGAPVKGAASVPDAGEAAGLPASAPRPDERLLDEAARALEDADRVLVWVGGGAVHANAGAAIQELARRLAAPVVETYNGRGVSGAQPFTTGLSPHTPQIGALWDAADVVVAVGTDFDGMTTQNWLQPQPRTLVSVNVDAVEATKNYRADIALVGDARSVCEALVARLSAPRADAVDALAADLERRRADARRAIAADEPQAVELLDSLERTLRPDDVVVADMCIPGYWVASTLPFSHPRKLLYPVGWGTLGFAFPASLGAALADRGRTLCICGDGGFLFAAGELATLAQERVALTVLIVDDSAYGMLRFDQQEAGDEVFGVELRSPDFAAWASGCGIAAHTVDGVGDDLVAALNAALASRAPAVVVAKASLKPPLSTSPRWYRRRSSPSPC